MKKLFVLIAMLVFTVSLANAVELVGPRAVVCDEVITESPYLRCIVNDASEATFGGGFDAVPDDDIILVNQVLSGSDRLPPDNVILDIRGSDFTLSRHIFFKDFDSLLISGPSITLSSGLSFLVQAKRFFNLSNSEITAPQTFAADALFINLLDDAGINTDAYALLLASSVYTAPTASVDVIEGGAGADIAAIVSDTGLSDLLTAMSPGVDFSFLNLSQSPRTAQGNLNITGRIHAGADGIIGILTNVSKVTVGSLLGRIISIQGNRVYLGTSGYTNDIGVVGHSNVYVISLEKLYQRRGFKIYGKNVVLFSNDDMSIKDNIDTRSPAGTAGVIYLAGNKSLTIWGAADIRSRNSVSAATYAGLGDDGYRASINLSFPAGNIRIRGNLDSYSFPVPQPKVNAIEITGGHVSLENPSEFRIESANYLTIRSPSIYLPDTVASSITADQAGIIPFGEDIRLYTCSTEGIPAALEEYYIQDLSFCPAPRVINVYGYLTNPGGQPYSIGSAKVNSVRVAIPNGAYIAGSGPDGNVSATYNSVFSSTSAGFFSFSLPSTSLTSGAYKVNVTFSNSSTFICDASAFCQNREVIASVSSG